MWLQCVDAIALEMHGALTRPQQAEHHFEQRRLAGPVRPDHGHDLTTSQRKVDPAEDVHLGDVSSDETADLKQRAVSAQATSSACAPKYASITRWSLSLIHISEPT